MQRKADLQPSSRDASLRPASFDEKDNSVEVIWTTGAPVRRFDRTEGRFYDEQLIVEDSAIRLGRLNNGAPFLDTHNDFNLSSVIGVVETGSAKLRDGKGYARVRLSVAEGHRDIVANIKAGIIMNISVGYRIHKVEKIEGGAGLVPIWRAVDWEPMELSAVPVPADAGSQIRGGKRAAEWRAMPCEFRSRSPTDRDVSWMRMRNANWRLGIR